MNARLSQFMVAENINSAKLAEILDIQPSSISHLLSGRNKPGFDFISKLMTMFPDLNPDWIINGKGDMYRGENGEEPKNVTKLNIGLDNSHNYTTNHTDTKITDVNTVVVEEPVLEPVSLPTPIESENGSQIEKIILFYADNTFELMTKR